jgi:glutathione S-transferase
MIILYSYPELFGVADNNPFGLKVFAFLKLAGLPFTQQFVFDARTAPRGQLPYIRDDGATVGDSDNIIAHVKARHGLMLDAQLSAEQQTIDLLVRRALDDLYWVMSYSRWRDDRFWPVFREAMLTSHPDLTAEGMDAARAYNFERYRHQGIGRYEPDEVYARGLADLQAVASLIPADGYVFSAEAASIDAALYGFIANILYFDIDTPLKRFVLSQPSLLRHTEAMHARVAGEGRCR